MIGFREYLSFAERYLSVAEDDLAKNRSIDWLLIPATVMSWSAIESFVNNRLDDLGSVPPDMFQMHERAFLLEKRLRFIDRGANKGEFVLEGTEYHPLEDKIFFLAAKFGKQKGFSLNLGDTLWQDFNALKQTRDSIVHPRIDKQQTVDIADVYKFIETAKQVIQFVSVCLWSRKLDF